MAFGWAYVDCSGSGGGVGGASGPSGSIQFMTASGTGVSSGSVSLTYHPSASLLTLTGTLIISGAITASHYHIEDVTVINSSGSTFFGDTNDDIHARTGSLTVKTTGGDINLNVDATSGRTTVRGFRVSYSAVTSSIYTASTPSYIIGVRTTGSVNIQIPAANASAVGAGYIMLVKDELTSSRGGNNITLTAPASGKIDGDPTFVLTGSMPAISLYSNGTNWFVF
jgi:hypothetical protein